MDWEIKPSGSLAGGFLPYPHLQQAFELVLTGEDAGEIHSVEWWATMPDPRNVRWPQATVHMGPVTSQPREPQDLRLTLPVHPGLIGAIERWRQGRPNPVQIDFTFNIYSRPIRHITVPVLQTASGMELKLPGGTTKPVGEATSIGRKQVRASIQVNRDDWIGILRGLEWDQLTVYEVPTLEMKRHERFQQALAILNEAYAALRQGQWSTAVTDSRRALEAAAAIAAPEANRKAKFDTLLQEVLPNPSDGPKRETLSSLMAALRDLRNEAAHVNSLSLQIERADAELAVTTALAIFRYIGEALRSR